MPIAIATNRGDPSRLVVPLVGDEVMARLVPSGPGDPSWSERAGRWFYATVVGVHEFTRDGEPYDPPQGVVGVSIVVTEDNADDMYEVMNGSYESPTGEYLEPDFRIPRDERENPYANDVGRVMDGFDLEPDEVRFVSRDCPSGPPTFSSREELAAWYASAARPTTVELAENDENDPLPEEPSVDEFDYEYSGPGPDAFRPIQLPETHVFEAAGFSFERIDADEIRIRSGRNGSAYHRTYKECLGIMLALTKSLADEGTSD